MFVTSSNSDTRTQRGHALQLGPFFHPPLLYKKKHTHTTLLEGPKNEKEKREREREPVLFSQNSF